MASYPVQHLDSDQEEEKHTPTIQELQAIIRSLNTTVTRLRASREIYRSNIKTLTVKNKELEARLAAVNLKEEAIPEPLDFDLDEAEQSVKLEKTSIPTVHTTKITTTGNNKRYPNVPDYYGDKAKWDGWRFHLASANLKSFCQISICRLGDSGRNHDFRQVSK